MITTTTQFFGNTEDNSVELAVGKICDVLVSIGRKTQAFLLQSKTFMTDIVIARGIEVTYNKKIVKRILAAAQEPPSRVFHTLEEYRAWQNSL